MAMDQVVEADAEELLHNQECDDEDDTFFQDIDMLQNHGIVSAVETFLFFTCLNQVQEKVSFNFYPFLSQNSLLFYAHL